MRHEKLTADVIQGFVCVLSPLPTLNAHLLLLRVSYNVLGFIMLCCPPTMVHFFTAILNLKSPFSVRCTKYW